VAVVTDPKNAKVGVFYRKYGFQNLGGGRRMFMTMRAIENLLGDGMYRIPVKLP